MRRYVQNRGTNAGNAPPTQRAFDASAPRPDLKAWDLPGTHDAGKCPAELPPQAVHSEGDLRFVFSCGVGSVRYERLIAPVEISHDAAHRCPRINSNRHPVRWMLVFRRAICAHAEVVEMSVGGVEI